ncbi:MAG TPA: sigma-70 family RNA polymerase sigma factor [Planctomycetota bacterium]
MLLAPAWMDVDRCEQLWRRHADRLLLYAASLLSDRAAAEDVLQNVFVRLIASGPPEEIASDRGYLFRAVRNEALNALRSRRLARKASTPYFAEPADPVEEAERADFGRRAEAALRAIPTEEREAVVLKIWSDLSFPDAAAVTGVSEKTFEHRYYRGLAALKEVLGERHG